MALPALEIEITADPTAADVGFKKLERSLDGLEAATQDYQRALDRINKAERVGIVTTKQAAAAVKGAEQAYESAARAAANYSGAQVGFRKSTTDAATATGGLMAALSRNNNAIQQAGYQIGDFAVQVGGGTSAITAFAQQGSQMLGVFGMWGAIAGAALAVTAPLLLAFKNSAETTKTLAQNLEGLAEAMDAVNSAQDRASTSIFDLNAQYGEHALAVGKVLAAQREIANFEAEAALGSATSQLAEAFGNLSTVVDDMGQTIVPGAEEAFRKIIRTMRPTSKQAMDLVNSLRALGDAEGPDAQRDAISRVKDALVAATGGVAEMDAETLRVYKSLLDAELAASRLAAIDIKAGISGAADEALRLTTNLENSAKAWDAYNFAKQIPMGVTTGTGLTMADVEGGALLPPSAGGGGGGGGGGRSQAPDTLGALAKSLMSQNEVLENWRTESLAKLEEFNALELAALGGHNEARLRIEDEYQSKLAGIKLSQRQMMIGSLSAALGDVGEFVQKFAGKSKAAAIAAIAIQKGLSIAQITANTAAAQMRALAELGPIAGPPAAAKIGLYGKVQAGLVLATGLMQASGAGGSSASSGGGGGASTAVAAAPAPSNYYIDLQGDTFSRASVQSTISAALQGEIDRGARVVFGGA